MPALLRKLLIGSGVAAAFISEPDVAFLIRVGAGRSIANGTVLR